MSDYTFEALVRLRVTADDFHEAAERAEEFFSTGLEQLAYSTDDEEDYYVCGGIAAVLYGRHGPD